MKRDSATADHAERARPDFRFSLRELSGCMGDFGSLFPLAVGYITVNGLDPAGLFMMLGPTNVALGLVGFRMGRRAGDLRGWELGLTHLLWALRRRFGLGFLPAEEERGFDGDE